MLSGKFVSGRHNTVHTGHPDDDHEGLQPCQCDVADRRICVVMWSFKSLIIPLLIMIPIEVAIFVNMAVPYIVGDTMIFIGYIIVSL